MFPRFAARSAVRFHRDKSGFSESGTSSGGPGGDTPDMKSLLEQLRSRNAEEQIEAVLQLGALGPYAQPAIKPLVELLKTNNPVLRHECIVCWVKSGRLRMIPQIV